MGCSSASSPPWRTSTSIRGRGGSPFDLVQADRSEGAYHDPQQRYRKGLEFGGRSGDSGAPAGTSSEAHAIGTHQCSGAGSASSSTLLAPLAGVSACAILLRSPRRTDECGGSFTRFSLQIKRRKRRGAPSKTARPTGGIARQKDLADEVQSPE